MVVGVLVYVWLVCVVGGAVSARVVGALVLPACVACVVGGVSTECWCDGCGCCCGGGGGGGGGGEPVRGGPRVCMSFKKGCVGNGAMAVAAAAVEGAEGGGACM